MRRLAALVAAAGALAGGLSACSGGTYQVVATFDDVGDLQSCHGVQVADVRVGRVQSIELTEGYKARVTLSVDKGVRVPRNSRALLRTTSLLGEKFVELRPEGAPDQGPFLADGDVVGRAEEAPEFEFVAQEAVTVLGAIAAGDVATLIDTGAEAFGGRQAELRSLVEDLAGISRTLADRTGTIQSVIDRLDKASATLAAGSGDIAALFDNLAEATRVLADNRQRAVDALARLDRLARVQNDVLDRYRDEIDRQIKQVNAIAAIAAEHTEEVGALVDWLDRFITSLPQVVPGDFTLVYMWVIPAAQDPRARDAATQPPSPPPGVPGS